MFFWHILFITLSNILVQYPFKLVGLHTTWGALTYPVIFILTDLTTRLYSPQQARKIIFQSMFPGLIISYGLAAYIESQSSHFWETLHVMPLRIACACFIAYVIGQLMDIWVFQNYRHYNAWWFAPAISIMVGNVVDTVLFFAIAFFHSSNAFLSQHWVEIAMVDIGFKIAVSFFGLIPLYGVILNQFSRYLRG